MRIFIRAIIPLLLFIPSTAFSLWIDKIQTESDWEYLYRDGWYDYNSYQIYRGFPEGSSIIDTVEYLLSSLGIDPVETVDRPAAPRIHGSVPAGIKGSASGRRIASVRFRMGRKILKDKNEGYVLVSPRIDNLSSSFKFREENGDFRAERRWIRYTGDRFTITLGDFLNNIGCGLGIGRFDYRALSYESELGSADDFLFPDNSYFNGIKITYASEYVILYSLKRYYDIKKSVIGGAASLGFSNFRMGATASVTSLSSSDGSSRLGTGSVFIVDNDGGLKSEIAYGESGIGMSAQIIQRGFDIRAWYYDDSFVNLQSSGFCHPDYVSYSDVRFELSFRQPQSGETGMFLKKKHIYKSIELAGALEVWKRSPVDNVALNNSLQFRYLFPKNYSTLVRYSNRFKRNAERTIIELGASQKRRYRIDLLVSLWVENEAIRREKSRYYLYFLAPLRSRIFIGGRTRWDFDGNFDFYIEEKTMVKNSLSLKVTYRWMNSYSSDQGPLYLVLGNRW